MKWQFSIPQLLVGVLILIVSYIAIKQANPAATDAGAFFIAFIISVATYQWVAKQLHVR